MHYAFFIRFHLNIATPYILMTPTISWNYLKCSVKLVFQLSYKKPSHVVTTSVNYKSPVPRVQFRTVRVLQIGLQAQKCSYANTYRSRWWRGKIVVNFMSFHEFGRIQCCVPAGVRIEPTVLCLRRHSQTATPPWLQYNLLNCFSTASMRLNQSFLQI